MEKFIYFEPDMRNIFYMEIFKNGNNYISINMINLYPCLHFNNYSQHNLNNYQQFLFCKFARKQF